MRLLRALITNHPLANVAFLVIMMLGAISYATMPREQDPDINFNWVSVTAALPGASAEDVERLITNPLEEAIQSVPDVRFVVSSSRESMASLLVRFTDISSRTFDKRMNDLRREIQNRASTELPDTAKTPRILEITTSNGFPTARLLLTGPANDEVLRRAARRLKTDIERIKGIDQVFASGLRDPELRVIADPVALAARGLQPNDVSDTLQGWWRDTSGGNLRTQQGAWTVTLKGVNLSPEGLAHLPVLRNGKASAVRLGDVARIERDRANPSQLTSTGGQDAVSFAITKKAKINTLNLVDTLRAFVAEQNETLARDGLHLQLSDDQTVPTRNAIDIMQTNALYGFVLVLAVSWLFLGTRIGMLVALGIPFSLLGTFAVLDALGYTVNVSVLLGVVIALGMLVDDAVVVVEAIYYRLERGQASLEATLDGLLEVWKPVLASVITTVAAFLPLMLLPGIVGKFMFVIPFVVTLALAISLIEAFWMMPVHASLLGHGLHAHPGRVQRWRNGFNRKLRLRYGQWLAYVLRRPKRFLGLGVVSMVAAVALVATGVVRVQFFAFDPIRIFYVNVDMPANATLEDTLHETQAVEAVVRRHLKGVGERQEARSVTSTAGLKFTQTEPVYGDSYGQVFVSLNPRNAGGEREVRDVVEAMRSQIEGLPGPGRKSFTLMSGGPPAGKAISVKVRGDDFDTIQAAADALKAAITQIPGAQDVQDDNLPGRPQLALRLNPQAMTELGLNAAQVSRWIRLGVDGEVVAFTRDSGDKVDLRVMTRRPDLATPEQLSEWLSQPIALPNGQTARLDALVSSEPQRSRGVIRHYNLRRTITVEANLDKNLTDTKVANAAIAQAWSEMRQQYPGISLDFTGELEDIEESLKAMQQLFLMGVGLIYLILAAQFRSYYQPLLILVTVPLAFTGVAYGLALTDNPLSLYTLYGVIALTGIAVNSAIVLIDAANDRLLEQRMSLVHALVLAARRRVVPILITSTTTLGGLFSLAFGIGGHSLLWGPVASSMFWGLLFSTVLTLFIVPLLYLMFMRRVDRRLKAQTLAEGHAA